MSNYRASHETAIELPQRSRDPSYGVNPLHSLDDFGRRCLRPDYHARLFKLGMLIVARIYDEKIFLFVVGDTQRYR